MENNAFSCISGREKFVKQHALIPARPAKRGSREARQPGQQQQQQQFVVGLPQGQISLIMDTFRAHASAHVVAIWPKLPPKRLCQIRAR